MLLLVAGSVGLRGQAFSPYSDFLNMTPQQLGTLQVKLTYLGIQNKVLPSLGYSATNPFNLSLFTPFYRPGFSYGNDNSIKTYTVTTTELQAILTQVGTLSTVTAGGVAAIPFISFSMSGNINNQNEVFEAIVDAPTALQLFSALRAALQTLPPIVSTLTIMACPTALTDPGIPTDVTSQTHVSLSGVRLDRSTGLFVGTATITNTSSSAIAGPVSLILGLRNGIKLANATGNTCLISPVGAGFINPTLSGGALAPAAAVTVTVQYSNPNQQPIQPTVKVVAGSGSR
jgi:hypothetical protein